MNLAEQHIALTMTGEAHPLAGIFPLLEGDEFDALVRDIRANGLRTPVLVTPAGLIVDGRNRFRACKAIDNQAGARDVPEHARLRVLISQTPSSGWADLVMSLNLHRRHMSTSQRALTAARWGLLKGAPSQQGRAREMSVGLTTLKHAESVLASGDEDLIKRVESGKVRVSAAASLKPKRQPKPEPPVEDSGTAEEAAKAAEEWINSRIQATDEHGQPGSSSASRQRAAGQLPEDTSEPVQLSSLDLLIKATDGSVGYDSSAQGPEEGSEEPPFTPPEPQPEESSYERRQRLLREAVQLIAGRDPWEGAVDVLNPSKEVRETAGAMARDDHRHAVTLVLHGMAHLTPDERRQAILQMSGLLTAEQRYAVAVAWQAE